VELPGATRRNIALYRGIYKEKSYMSNLFTRITKACSPERLSKYRINKEEGEADVLARYMWNMALCEALYPSLLNFEIVLRNNLHDALSDVFDDDTWFDDSEVLVIAEWRMELRRVKDVLRKRAEENAEKAFRRDGKRRQPKPVTTGQIIAELPLGFWTSLLSKEYANIIWIKPDIITKAFPHYKKFNPKRSIFAERFHDIKYIRNRVFHYEPIWARPNLQKEHKGILEAIGWMNVALWRVTTAIDRFDTVYSQETQNELKATAEKLVGVAGGTPSSAATAAPAQADSTS
jgi:hypothetical protein